MVDSRRTVRLADWVGHAISRGVRFLPLFFLAAVAQVVAAADPAMEPPPDEASASGVEFHTGTVDLPNRIARLELAEGYRYLNPSDARTVFEELWGNPPITAEGFQGMVVPHEEDLENAGAWVAMLAYSEEGHLSDAVMTRFNAGAYLEYLKDQNAKENEKRKSEGLPVNELMDWVGLPMYSSRTKIFSCKKRFWNEQAKRGRETVLEYENWVLGRRGRIIVHVIAPEDQKHTMTSLNASEVPEMIRFNRGHRHEDFDPKSDRLARFPTAMLAKEAAKEGKSFVSALTRRLLPMLIVIGVSLLVMKGVNKLREA